jgi:putative acetyltransferase
VGCAGVVATDDHGVMERKKVYVAKGARQMGLGARLCSLVEVEVMSRRINVIELWSDTRFLDAHRQYESRGYVRGSDTRELHDKSNSVEYYYRRVLG